MAQYSDTDSTASRASLQALELPEHLQSLNESKVAIRLAAKNHRAAYARLSAMDPQTWEDPSCDIDLFEEVSEVDNMIMNICSSVSAWSKEIVEACDPYNKFDRSFCRSASAFIARIKDQVDRSPILLKSNREDEHQMGRRMVGTIQNVPEGNKRLHQESFLAEIQPPSKAPRPGSPFPRAILPAFTEMDHQDNDQTFNPPGSVNVNQQEVGMHRPIAIGMRRHSNRRISFGRESNQAEAQGPLGTPLIDLNGPPAELAQAAAQAPSQPHLLAPTSNHMSQEEIEEANKRFKEEEERLAQINKQRLAIEAVEEQLAAAQKEISRQEEEKAKEAQQVLKKAQEKREAEKQKAIEKKAREAAEKEKKEKERVAEEKRRAAENLQKSSLRIMKEKLGSREEELQRAK